MNKKLNIIRKKMPNEYLKQFVIIYSSIDIKYFRHIAKLFIQIKKSTT